MLDKRAIIRDMRAARFGLSRRIRLRIRSVTEPAAGVDPLAALAPAPTTDTLKYITGQFVLLKSTQDYEEAGAVQQERGVIYFHPLYKSLIESSYSMYVGGTGKEWLRISPVTYDSARSSLKVIVEASQ